MLAARCPRTKPGIADDHDQADVLETEQCHLGGVHRRLLLVPAGASVADRPILTRGTRDIRGASRIVLAYAASDTPRHHGEPGEGQREMVARSAG